MRVAPDVLSAEVLKAALDGEPLGVAIYRPTPDGDFAYDYVNPPFQAVKPETPMLGRTYSEVWPEYAEEVLPRLAEVVRTGEPWIESDFRQDVEERPGVVTSRYFALEVSRISAGTTPLLLASFMETTSHVETRNALEGSLETSQLLLEAADALAASVRFDEVIGALATVVRKATGRQRVVVSLYDAERDEVEIANASLFESIPKGSRLPLAVLAPAFRRMFEYRQPQVIDYDAPDVARLSHQRAQAIGFRLVLAVPIMLADRVLGAFTLDDPGERRAFTQREIDITVGIASQAAVAIENSRLYAMAVEAARYGEALNTVNAEVSSTLDIDEVMRVVVERTAETVNADVGVIYMPVDGEWDARYTWQAPPWLARARLREADIPYSAQASRDKRVELFGDVTQQPGWDRSLARRLDAREVLDAPLFLGRDESGDMTLYKIEGRRYTESDRDFVQKVSTSVSLALQNARRYESERKVADTLQEALLKLPETIGGMEFAHVYNSAAEAARVGGDFYDLFELEHGLLGVTVGDIAGKGLEASVLTSLVKNAIRAEATEPGKSPAEVLDVVNTVVLRATADDVFSTVFFGVLECDTGRLVYSNAGHTTGAIVRPKGDEALEPLPSNGPLLGALPDVVFRNAETRLGIGETLFLYTDGLTEARRDREDLFGEQRVFGLLEELRGERPSAIVRRMLQAAVEFAGGQLSDDLAILALRRTGDGA